MSANTIVAFSNTKPTYFLKNFERPLDFNQVLSTTEFPSTERLKDGFGRFCGGGRSMEVYFSDNNFESLMTEQLIGCDS